MRSISSLVLLLVSVVSAAPMGTVSALTSGKHSCATPLLPTTGAVSALPAPAGTLTYVALGRGVQNYTCSAIGATPVALGAVASLYDATEYAKCASTALNNFPGIAVYTDLPSTSSASFMGLKPLGKHFFDASGTPTFDLSSVNKILYAAKTGDIDPPINSSPGPADTGAVDWLSLAAKSTYVSVGLTSVYRVETAGGNSINPCTTAGIQSIQYAAQYWFYS
ncbi:uncharacterized protein EAF01_004293 [Botrytis porri]|uniref:Malate dehydrogenase n=1 Tax=Botrytis porri TaxID=87229 RepID=A0A4Z1KW90_9HELO|nr:uncharacterized protein EAF01_004293 [Botrytis porri]KAF7908538.1 hypothetical protein EAF01_004293 [Botrytis porri]TGO88790.1 hypothetical protein BPOR_0141g00010 [Botrytis porri]